MPFMRTSPFDFKAWMHSAAFCGGALVPSEQ